MAELDGASVDSMALLGSLVWVMWQCPDPSERPSKGRRHWPRNRRSEATCHFQEEVPTPKVYKLLPLTTHSLQFSSNTSK